MRGIENTETKWKTRKRKNIVGEIKGMVEDSERKEGRSKNE